MPTKLQIYFSMLEYFKRESYDYPLHIRAVACVLVEDLIKKERRKNHKKLKEKKGGKKNEKNNHPVYIGRVNF